MFTHCLTMSTKTLKPRPTYRKDLVHKKKTMNEQSSTPQTLTKVQSHLDDIYLIERDALWNDMQQRIKIHNYECKAALEDLKQVVNKTKELYSKVTTKV